MAPRGPCRHGPQPIFLEKPPGTWLPAPCTWRPLTHVRRMPLVLVRVSFHGKRRREPGHGVCAAGAPSGQAQGTGLGGRHSAKAPPAPRPPWAVDTTAQHLCAATPHARHPHSVALTLRPAALSSRRPGAETGLLRLSPTPTGAGHPATSSGPKLTRPEVMS